MKKKFNIPVVFTVKAESEEKAKEYVDRLIRYGFDGISGYEGPTVKAIKGWNWAAIRPIKQK